MTGSRSVADEGFEGANKLLKLGTWNCVGRVEEYISIPRLSLLALLVH